MRNTGVLPLVAGDVKIAAGGSDGGAGSVTASAAGSGGEGFRESFRTSPAAYGSTAQVNEALLGRQPGDLFEELAVHQPSLGSA